MRSEEPKTSLSPTGLDGVVGLIFCGLVYPLTMIVRQEPALAMMLSVYVTLGIFLLLAARNPSANRSLIAFTAWSSFAHAALMAVQAFRNLIPRGELLGVAAQVYGPVGASGQRPLGRARPRPEKTGTGESRIDQSEERRHSYWGDVSMN